MNVASPSFTRESTTDDVLDGVDVTGAVILITGGSSGLGEESARALAAKGADVIITARDIDKAKNVIANIQSTTGQTVSVESLELGSFASIRDFAKRINGQGKKIDVLINNAGVMACPESKTEDGLELQFGSNHIGHFLMTNLIVDSLNQDARVISLSSSGHNISPVNFDDINFEQQPYEKWQAYGQAKTANALFAVGLNKRLQPRGIEAFAVHPGVIVTNLGRHLNEKDYEQFAADVSQFELFYKSVEQGAATQLFAATSPSLNGLGGSYLANSAICRVTEAFDNSEYESTVRPHAMSMTNADRLWALSESIVGETFSY